MMRSAMILVVLMAVAAPARGQTFESLGSFANVRSNDKGKHCSGYSIGLWRNRGRVIGLFNVHEGLCGDPPCGVIEDVSLNSKTGRLLFAATVRRRWTFDGTLTRDGLTGTLNGQHVHLTRERTRSRVASDRSLAGWCEFWSAIPRCRGVTVLCSLLKRGE